MKTFLHRKTLLGVVAVLVLGQATLTHAADICLSTGGILPDIYVFKKVKSLKKAGAVSPLNGYVLSTVYGTHPLAGSAVVTATLQVRVGITIHNSNGSSTDSTAGWLANDATLQGTAAIDTDGDFSKDDAFPALTTIDCSTVPAIP